MATILVADDDEAIRSLLREILESEKHVSLTASDGAKALAILKEKPVDLLMTDVFMPGMDGLELIKAVRAGGSTLPIIALSGAGPGLAKADFLRFARAFGADRILPKPFRLTELRTALDACLSTTRLEP
ncbi:MAG: response regulator [Rhodospirillales bacterium]